LSAPTLERANMKIELTCNDESAIEIVTKLCNALGIEEYTHNISDSVIRLMVGKPSVKKDTPCCHHEQVVAEVKKPEQIENNLHVCKHCGKKFKAKCSSQAYCSRKCKRKAAWKRESAKANAEDDGCGRGLETQKAKPSFKSSFEKSLKVKKCTICGKEFKQKCPRQIYCSDECKKAARRVCPSTPTVQAEPPVIKQPTLQPVVKKPIVVPSVPTVKKICEVCSFPFETQNENQRFCNKCYNSLGIIECVNIVNERKQDEKAREEARRIKYKVCPKCGRNFTAKDPDKEFFCPACSEKMINARNKR